MEVCHNCGVELTDNNWPAGRKKQNRKVCANCVLTRSKKWRKENPGKYRKYIQRQQWYLKIRVFNLLGGCRCVKCGASDLRILTINHLNGSRRNEKVSQRSFFYSIINGTRNTKELEIRCFNCNMLYEYEKGRLSLPNRLTKYIKT